MPSLECVTLKFVIKEEDKVILVAGCAHRGIVHIIHEALEQRGKVPQIVIAGFHLSSRSTGSKESLGTIEALAHVLGAMDTDFYTCHCIGVESYEVLSGIMGNQIHYLEAGNQLKVSD